MQNTNTPKKNIILMILSLLLFCGLIILCYNAYELNDQINNLKTQISTLTSEKQSIQSTLDATKQNISDAKKVLKDYFTHLQVLDGDLNVIQTTYNTYLNTPSSAGYEANKIHVDRYKLQVSTFKKHLDYTIELLRANDAIFTKAGINSKLVSEKFETVRPIYNDNMDDMDIYLEELKEDEG